MRGVSQTDKTEQTIRGEGPKLRMKMMLGAREKRRGYGGGGVLLYVRGARASQIT